MKNKQKNNEKNKSFMIIIGLYSKGHFKTKENILKSRGDSIVCYDSVKIINIFKHKPGNQY